MDDTIVCLEMAIVEAMTRTMPWIKIERSWTSNVTPLLPIEPGAIVNLFCFYFS